MSEASDAPAAALPAVGEASAPDPSTVPKRLLAAVARVTLVLLLGLFALWRVTLGAALSDDGHVVVLALRMARGAVPLRDEMNFQVLGSVWAVPFVWVWDQTVGVSGLVLFSRVLYLFMAAGVLAVVHRALRGSFSFWVLLPAAAVPLLAPPYGILTISYNTAPMLGLVLATAATWAAWRDASGRWAVVAGLGLAVAAFSAPATLPAVLWAVVAFVVLRPNRRTAVPLLATLGGLGALTLMWVTLVPGWHSVGQTLALTQDAVGLHDAGGDKLKRLLASYWVRMTDPTLGPGQYSYRPALALTGAATVLACLPRRRWLDPLPALALAAVPVTLLAPGIDAVLHTAQRLALGSLGAVDVVWLVFLLMLPVLAQAVRTRRWDLVRLVLVTVPGGLAAGAMIAVVTSSRAAWGAPVGGLTGAAFALLLAWAALVDRALHDAGRWLINGLLPAMCLILALVPFRDPYPWLLTARVPEGAYWGISTSPTTLSQIASTMTVARSWVRPGDDVLVYGSAGTYLLVGGEPLTNLTWLAPRGPGNAPTITYLDTRGRWPDVVLVDPRALGRVADLAGAARADPFLGRVLRDYRITAEDPGARLVVLRRR